MRNILKKHEKKNRFAKRSTLCKGQINASHDPKD
jgi:hypothetical protein